MGMLVSMRSLTSPAAIVSIVLMCGCHRSPGSPDSPSSLGSVTGTIHGQPLVIADAVSAVVMVPDTGTGGTDQIAQIVMGNAAGPSGLCADFAANSQPSDFHGMYIALIVLSGSTPGPPTSPGTFTISTAPDIASLGSFVTDASCKDVSASDAAATGGAVTLTAISGNTFSGHFDVMLNSGDRITGDFSPHACPDLQNWAHHTVRLSCI
jgi:hypothetical protein